MLAQIYPRYIGCSITCHFSGMDPAPRYNSPDPRTQPDTFHTLHSTPGSSTHQAGRSPVSRHGSACNPHRCQTDGEGTAPSSVGRLGIARLLVSLNHRLRDTASFVWGTICLVGVLWLFSTWNSHKSAVTHSHDFRDIHFHLCNETQMIPN